MTLSYARLDGTLGFVGRDLAVKGMVVKLSTNEGNQTKQQHVHYEIGLSLDKQQYRYCKVEFDRSIYPPICPKR